MHFVSIERLEIEWMPIVRNNELVARSQKLVAALKEFHA
jgi:hypothetical protein